MIGNSTVTFRRIFLAAVSMTICGMAAFAIHAITKQPKTLSSHVASQRIFYKTISGVQLSSLFDGLPISPKFGGRSPSVDLAARNVELRKKAGLPLVASAEQSRLANFADTLQHFFGLSTIVHAQTCNGCYQHQEQRCDCYPCSGCWITVYVDYHNLRGVEDGGQGCNPPWCQTQQWNDCDGGSGCY